MSEFIANVLDYKSLARCLWICCSCFLGSQVCGCEDSQQNPLLEVQKSAETQGKNSGCESDCIASTRDMLIELSNRLNKNINYDHPDLEMRNKIISVIQCEMQSHGFDKTRLSDVLVVAAENLQIGNPDSKKFPPVHYGGTVCPSTNAIIYIDSSVVAGKEWRRSVSRAFHDEFSSILYRRYPGIFPYSQWLDCNNGFTYQKKLGYEYLTNEKPNPDWSKLARDSGILLPESLSSIEEDINSYAELIFTCNPVLWEWYDTSQSVKAKTELLVNYYNRTLGLQLSIENLRLMNCECGQQVEAERRGVAENSMLDRKESGKVDERDGF